MPTVTLSVDPATPLRFRDTEGKPTLTRFVSGPENDWAGAQLTSLPNPEVGTYEVQITLPPYAPAAQSVAVRDDAFRRLRAEPKGDWRAGQEATLTVFLVDRAGQVDSTFSDLLSNNAVSVFVTGPVSPVVIRRRLSMPTVHELLFDQGQALFTFTPQAPGSYQVVAQPNGQMRPAVRYEFDVGD